MKSRVFLFALVSVFSFTFADLPKFRFTDKAPFTANGKRVGAVWATADIFKDFITVPGYLSGRDTYHAAVFQTQASVLFDATNIYISVRGQFNPQLKHQLPEKSLFGNNNYEVFFRLDPASPYVQIALDDLGRLYTGIGNNATEIPGLKHSIESTVANASIHYWFANLTVPFASINASAPSSDQQIKFGVMRNNINTYKQIPEVSSLAPVPVQGTNYRVPDIWADAIMTREASPAKAYAADYRGNRINLIPNDEFNMPVEDTAARTWMETMAMSGEWIIRSSGNAYQFYTVWPMGFKPDTEYTLKIRARNFGGDGGLRILHMRRMPDGRHAEGTYVAMNLPLGSEFHEFYLPFKSTMEQPTSLVLYKLGSKETSCGVDIAAVQLYEGKISSFEIRKLSSSGILKAASDAQVPVLPDSFYGKSAVSLRVLAVVGSVQNITESNEIFAGSDVLCDTLNINGSNQDIYGSFSDSAEVQENLQSGKYDVYMIGSNTAHGIGEEMIKIIEENVRAGAALYLSPQKQQGNFKPLLAEAKLADLATGHELTRSFPDGLFTLNSTEVCALNQKMKLGSYGKGKVLTLAGPSRLSFKQIMNSTESSVNPFPSNRFVDAWIVRVLHHLAKKSDFAGGELSVSGNKGMLSATLPAGAYLSWSLVDKDGVQVGTGESQPGQASFTFSEMILTGKHFLTVKVLDDKGKTLDYICKVLEKSGPSLSDFQASATSYTSDQRATFTIAASSYAPATRLVWQLLDFSGRIIESDSFVASESNTFTVPLNRFYTNFSKLQIYLEKDAQRVASFAAPVFIRDLDAKRSFSDYTASIWPAGNVSADTLAAIDVQLEEIGIRNYQLPLMRAPAAVISTGMSLSGVIGEWVGGGWTFCGWSEKDNIRQRNFNAQGKKEYFYARGKEKGEEIQPYGSVEAGVCDEPNFVRPGTTSELDSHPDNLAVYRERMETKYGTIGEFNRRHNTTYASFADLQHGLLGDARASGNYAEFIEWRSFNVDRWCEVIKAIGDGMKSTAPEVKFSLQNSFGQSALGGNDYWKLLSKAGLTFSREYCKTVYFGKSPLNNFDELYRSFAPEMKVWGWTGYFYSKDYASFLPWYTGAHRHGGFSWYATYGWGYNIVDIPTNAITIVGQYLKDSLQESRMLDGVGKIFEDFKWRENEIAIYYSHESLLLAFALGKETKEGEIQANGPLHDYYHSRQGAQDLIEELLYQYDFVAPEQICNGKLQNYKVLFMPTIWAVSDAEVEALRAFLDKGGKIIADSMPALHDELGVKRAAAPFTESQITVIGKNFSELDKSLRTEALSFFKEASVTAILESPDIVNYSGREAMHFTDGTMNIYPILRIGGRSRDNDAQTFLFPKKGHVYDLRSDKYLGFVDRVSLAVPQSNASLLGHYPYRVKEMKINMPKSVVAGKDLKAAIAVVPDKGRPGRHVFHLEVINPAGVSRFHFQRNVSAPTGVYDFVFRMAHNDPKGTWKLRATDVMTSTVREATFVLK